MADKRIDIVVTSKVKDALRGLGSVARSIGRVGTVGAATAGVGLAAVSFAAIKAAASYETLQLRLEAVTGSAGKASAMFEETRKFAASTPLRLDDLLNARVLMEGIGATGQASLKKAAGAAAALNKPLVEVASAVASLETEPLRRMGIEVRRVGEQATFQFRDKFGRSIKVVSNGIDDARKALLNIFSVKFGGFLEKASRTFNGLVSTLRDKLKDAAAQFGDTILPFAKRFVSEINDRLDELVKSGFLEDLGKNIVAGLMTVKDIGFALFKNIRDGSISLSQVFSASIKALVDSGSVVGNRIADAILDAVASSGLPGTGGVAARLVSQRINRAGELNRAGLISDAELLKPGADLKSLIAGAEVISVLGQLKGVGSTFASSLNLPDPADLFKSNRASLSDPTARFGVFQKRFDNTGGVSSLRFTGKTTTGPAGIDRAIRGNYVLVQDKGAESNRAVLSDILSTLRGGIVAVAQ